MKKYNIINNTLGWLMFAVAMVTYMLTLEPTASFWDCPEFIAQGFKSEIGHPPGNPIFILAARFFANFAGGDITKVSYCVNTMSAFFSAATILLLFWTTTHLVKKLVVNDGETESMSLAQYLVVMGSGAAAALAYTWSDTFWFSAVEAEVYAFSSFCTALVFWLALKWENRADEPDSDRWLILIAYVMGLSLGVHLLNLLCIPAIALVFYYRKCKNTNAWGSLGVLLLSFVIIVMILYGLEPGFVKMAQKFDLMFVNGFGCSFNSGALFYAFLLVAVLALNLLCVYKNMSKALTATTFLMGVLLSGGVFFTTSVGVWVLMAIAAIVGTIFFVKLAKNYLRIMANISLSILVIFIGFSCYALILIRSNANTPLDENSPNNTFELAKYLSREQYGESPLFYGRTFQSEIVYNAETGRPYKTEGATMYAQEVKTSPDEPDSYRDLGPKENYVYVPEQNMLFPRIHSEGHAREYQEWLGMQGTAVEGTTMVDKDFNPVRTETLIKPTFAENFRWFLEYQVNYMYWRYFMWNFSGRQNDIQGMGEVTNGNWISGIPIIDNLRLGDQSLLPDDMGKGNKGHNVFFMLPLLLGIVGLLWQAFRDKRGIEQFWVVFFLFFMTGLAIVVYLNQTPSQPRERDYAYAGSFYAFAIWIGLGVAGLWSILSAMFGKSKAGKADEKKGLAFAAVAAVVGLAVPLQMVSQTWDDHDRSGRYAARDFGMNYLSSLDENAIIFTNGDNDTFPLWYAQEVENYRTDVRVVNLSYLSTDWYIRQMQRAAYDSKPLPMQAGKTTFAYDQHQFNYFIEPDTMTIVPALKSLEHLYSSASMNERYALPEIKYPRVFIPINVDQAVKAGVVPAAKRDMAQEAIMMNLMHMGQGMSSSAVLSLDLISSSIAQGWNRPCYFAMTVPESFYLGLSPYMLNTGMAYQVTPFLNTEDNNIHTATDKMYANVTTKFRWGGLDTAEPGSLYLDETVRRMVSTTRTAMLGLVDDLTNEGVIALDAAERGEKSFLGKDPKAYAKDRFDKASTILDLMDKKLPAKACAYSMTMGLEIAEAYEFLGRVANRPELQAKGTEVLQGETLRFAQYARYYQSLSPSYANRLTRYDAYIRDNLFPVLCGTLKAFDVNTFNKTMQEITAMGVVMDGYIPSINYIYDERMGKPKQPTEQNDTTTAE